MVHLRGVSPPPSTFFSDEKPHIHHHLHTDDDTSIDTFNSFYDDENSFANNKGITTMEKLNELPSLNLKLRMSPSFINLVETTISQQEGGARNSGYGVVGRPRKSDVAAYQQANEKLKASNFSATLLRIGTWERVAKHEGHLVAKCYYAKKKLVWEFLESTLKRKIEILWSEISAIKATIEENEPGILEIELNHPPSFHHETDPQPRKHTNWKSTSDFTDGQALIWRRHYLKFPPGVLDKPYEKLLQCDSRLFELSQQPFPSSNSPYLSFNPSIYDPSDFSNLSFSLHGRHHFNPGLHYSLAHIPTSFVSEQVQSNRTTVASPDSAEAVSHRYHENPRRAFWGQGLNSFADTLAMEQVQAHMSIPSAIPPTVYYQNNNNNYIEGGSRSDLDTEMLLSDIENTLMSDSQVECTDEKYDLARIASLDALLCQSSEGNFALNTDANHIRYGKDVHAAAMHYEDTDNVGGLINPHSVSWVSHQVPEEISQPVSGFPPLIPGNHPRNNSFYSTTVDLATDNDEKIAVNRWS